MVCMIKHLKIKVKFNDLPYLPSASESMSIVGKKLPVDADVYDDAKISLSQALAGTCRKFRSGSKRLFKFPCRFTPGPSEQFS